MDDLSGKTVRSEEVCVDGSLVNLFFLKNKLFIFIVALIFSDIQRPAIKLNFSKISVIVTFRTEVKQDFSIV